MSWAMQSAIATSSQATLVLALGLGCAANADLPHVAASPPGAQASDSGDIEAQDDEAGIQLGSGGAAGPYEAYGYIWPPRLAPWQPDPKLAFDYFHLGEVGGSWPARAGVEIRGESRLTRAEARAFAEAFAPYRAGLGACHLGYEGTERRELRLMRTEEGVEVQALGHGSSEAQTKVVRCVVSVLADFEWPPATPSSLLLISSWR